jgi:hypothetical protein
MAAGQGFKTFTTGEVLTAADVNGYLMQGVLVFASAAARNAAITSPQEGQFAFTKDTNGLWYYDGAAWVASGATGDIEGVTAGVGITGGGTSGTVTITNDMATTITASGDIVVGTGSGTYDNLPIGTTGQVLTADTTVSPYKVKWATPAGGGGKTWTLINTGGTSLSGSSSVTVSGISDKEDLLILVYYAPITNASSEMQVRFNGDTGSNYTSYYNTITASSSYSVDSYNAEVNQNANYITIGKTSNNNTSEICAGMTVSGCKSTGIKNFWFNGGGSAKTGTGHVQRVGQGIYSATAAITSVNVSAGSNFTGGTLYVYGA